MAVVTANYVRFSPVSNMASFTDIGGFALKSNGVAVFGENALGVTNLAGATITASNTGMSTAYNVQHITNTAYGSGYIATTHNPVINIHFPTAITFDELDFQGLKPALSGAQTSSFVLETSMDGVSFTQVKAQEGLMFNDYASQRFSLVTGLSLEPTLFTQTDVNAAVTAGKVGLHTQTEVDAAVATAVAPLHTQTEVDTAVATEHTAGLTHEASAVADAVANAGGSGALTQAQLDTIVTDFNTNAANVKTVASVSTLTKLATDYHATHYDHAVIGNALNNTITANNDGWVVSGAAGNDTLIGGDDDDTLNGDAGDDSVNGSDGYDYVNGGLGNDTLSGDAGMDTLDGAAGNDLLNGGSDNDDIYGGAGVDTLNGDAGNDLLIGGLGVDVLTGGSDADAFAFNFAAAIPAVRTTKAISAINDSTFKAPDTVTDYNQADGDVLGFGSSDAAHVSIVGNYSAAVKGVTAHAATATKAEVIGVLAQPATVVNAHEAVFDVATHTLWVNMDSTPAFEMAVVLTGITDFSQITTM